MSLPRRPAAREGAALPKENGGDKPRRSLTKGPLENRTYDPLAFPFAGGSNFTGPAKRSASTAVPG
jgi:hypothetical protein